MLVSFLNFYFPFQFFTPDNQCLAENDWGFCFLYDSILRFCIKCCYRTYKHKGLSFCLNAQCAGDRQDQYSNLDPERIQRILLDSQAMLRQPNCNIMTFSLREKNKRTNRESNRDGWELELLSSSVHEETSSILLQQWNQSREDKWRRDCHGRVSHWSNRETNLSSFLSAGIRIIQCITLFRSSNPAVLSFVHILSSVCARQWTCCLIDDNGKMWCCVGLIDFFTVVLLYNLSHFILF